MGLYGCSHLAERVVHDEQRARMVKSADTADLKSADPYQVVGVQVPLRAPWNRLSQPYRAFFR